MKITRDILTEYAKLIIEDPNLLKQRQENKKRYLMFSGATKDVIEAAICREFKNPGTVKELMARLVPLNIMQKIINKLAGVYKEAPLRQVANKDERDQEMLDGLEDALDLNMRMKEANRFFKMNKRALIEPYLDDRGVPSLRVLPAHTYEPLSIGTKKKSVPNAIVKIDDTEEKLIWWSDESHWVTNLKGEILDEVMAKMDNPLGENPYGVLHFEYINESSNSVYPIQDDDLLALSIAIPVILTDLLFGLKYQCWAIIWTVGKVGNIPFNPNSVIQMDYGDDGQEPSINTIKPDIDSDKLLKAVLALVGLLLTTKNLQSGAITDGISGENAASGIAKVLDSAESVEDKKDQQAFFYRAEQGLFRKIRDLMQYWRETKQLNPEYDFDIPDDFAININFQEPRALMTEGEQIDNSKKKIDARLSTIRRELQKFNPDLDATAVDELYQEILAEQAVITAMVEKAKAGANGVEPKAQTQPA
jgi:hypothetical protein